MVYSEGFKKRMVQRLAAPDAISATKLSQEVGVAQATLSRWLHAARTLGEMKANQNDQAVPKSPRQWNPEDRLKAVVEALSLTDEERGAFLRQKGLHEAELEAWRQNALEALRGGGKRKAKNAAERKRIQQLERELLRKDRALAELTALLALKKKLTAIWGDEDERTPTRNGT